MAIGPIGLWSGQFRTASREDAGAAARLADDLGFDALWIPGGGSGEILDIMSGLLASTGRITIASGILNVWLHRPEDVAASHQGLRAAYGERYLLGLGVSHASTVEQATGEQYRQPYQVMVRYLDALDTAPTPVPAGERVLAALGPRMLALAAARSAGAHPYCVPVEHTRVARAALGAGPLLAPEVKVVLETDPSRARAIARAHLDRYLRQPNYANNLLRLGYPAGELADGGSDRVVDDLVAWGTVEQVAERVAEHREAGADHVCLQVLAEDPTAFPTGAWRELAAALC